MDLLEIPEPPVKPTGETLRPLLTGQAHIDINTAFGLLDDHTARLKAHGHAVRAGELQAGGAAVTQVFKALANAEGAAPESDRAWHAERVDAYAAKHGIRGWYRRTDFRGNRYIVADILRLTGEVGDRGRYYTHTDRYANCPPLKSWVIDRDTGRTAYRAINGSIAEQWIREHENA